jgi:hypothetical protein
MIKKSFPLNLYSLLAVLAVSISAVISLILTLHAGHKNSSIFLPALFIIWVSSPFVVLIVVYFKKRLFQDQRQNLSNLLMMVIAVGSLVAYSGILSPKGAKPAGIFLITPLISWGVLILSYIIIAKQKLK